MRPGVAWTNHLREYICQNKGDDKNCFLSNAKWKGGLSVPASSGRIIIMNQIGSTKRSIEGCVECFVCVTDSQDYQK